MTSGDCSDEQQAVDDLEVVVEALDNVASDAAAALAEAQSDLDDARQALQECQENQNP